MIPRKYAGSTRARMFIFERVHTLAANCYSREGSFASECSELDERRSRFGWGKAEFRVGHRDTKVVSAGESCSYIRMLSRPKTLKVRLGQAVLIYATFGCPSNIVSCEA